MNIPGTVPTSIQVKPDRLGELSRYMGALGHSDAFLAELRRVKEEHPTVPGLTLALAVAEKHHAVAQQRSSRLVLILATSGGMEVERLATAVVHRDDGGLDLVSYSDAPGAGT